jgi:hypothetical protein
LVPSHKTHPSGMSPKLPLHMAMTPASGNPRIAPQLEQQKKGAAGCGTKLWFASRHRAEPSVADESMVLLSTARGEVEASVALSDGAIRFAGDESPLVSTLLSSCVSEAALSSNVGWVLPSRCSRSAKDRGYTFLSVTDPSNEWLQGSQSEMPSGLVDSG